MILTIRATEMAPNEKHPIQYYFRFPRVTHIRKDKPWYSVCTDCEILSLVKVRIYNDIYQLRRLCYLLTTCVSTIAGERKN